jgi:hypothetical protein
MYIQIIKSISHQDSFHQENLWDSLTPLAADSTLISPDYKNYISPSSLRRLSPILRNALTVAKECQANYGNEIDAISVGTALGCLLDTEKFLVNIHTSQSDTLSPTAFIQSTHNTISGQISLELKNHAYNMTHTQNSLSFEQALLDGMLCIKDGKKHVLIGAADESISFLNQLKSIIVHEDAQLTSGATFMILSPNQSTSGIGILDFSLSLNTSNRSQLITDFLEKNHLNRNDIDLVLASGKDICATFNNAIDYLQYTGIHFTAVSFAVHMANDWLLKTNKKYVLIINEQQKGQIGLIILKNDKTSN